MYCYHCGCLLSEYDYCTACGADVGMYKKILAASNRFFNEGLERATVRNLSGAVESLRQSLKFNKNNIEARNLLGLVYYELGEGSAALCEWIISQSIRPEKNIASEYITMIQSNGQAIDAISQTMKKFNQALIYCHQGSHDLAVIQMKRVLSTNPKFVRAHQLLALLYIEMEEWEKAERELKRSLDLDHNNTQSLLYLKEVRKMIDPEEAEIKSRRKAKTEVKRYQIDNELIIQPTTVHEPKNTGFGTILNIVIGLIIGMAAMYFLVVPAKLTQVTSESAESLKVVSEQLDAKTATIQDLESQVKALNAEKMTLNETIAAYTSEDGTLNSIDLLLDAAKDYIAGADAASVSAALDNIASSVVLSEMSVPFQELFASLQYKVGPALADTFYSEGNEAYRDGDYDKAIDLFTKAYSYNEGNADALYNLGNAYRMKGDLENAIMVYEQVINLYPGTERATKSEQYLTEISAE